MKFRHLLYPVIAIPVFLILIWFFAIPTALIQKYLEEEVRKSGNGDVTLTVERLRKGVFFSLAADSLTIHLKGQPAIEITHFTGSLSPRHITARKIAVAVKGKIGQGDMRGTLWLPSDGTVFIDRADLDAIPLFHTFGIPVNGELSSEITIHNRRVRAVFSVPDLDVRESTLSAVPLMNSFRKVQGSLVMENTKIQVDSVSLEGEKAFARLSGDITNSIMNLNLELMPEPDALNPMESMLIGKYIVSPGYYIIPIRGPIPQQG